jgi:N-acetylneuraminic acid mutarotase
MPPAHGYSITHPALLCIELAQSGSALIAVQPRIGIIFTVFEAVPAAQQQDRRKLMPSRFVARHAVAALACLGALAIFPAAAQLESGTWMKVASLPQGRDEEQAVTIAGKIYLIGGAWDDVKDGKRDERYTDGFMTEFDPQTGTFRERSHGPEGLTHQGVVVLNGKIYMVGGFAGGHHTLPSAGVYSFDPATDKWQTLAPLPSPMGGISLAAVGGMIHVVGGRYMGEEGTLPVHLVYNPASNSWRQASPLPTSRDHAGVFVVDGKIHLIGGRTGEATENSPVHEIYDSATDKWSSAAPMPTARSSVAFAEYRGMLVLAGGECKMGKTYDEVEAYDINADRWVKLPSLRGPRHGFAAAAVGDKLFLFGGSTRCGGGGKVADVLQLTFK